MRESGLAISEEQTIEIAKISKFYFLVRYPDINRKFFASAEIAKTTLQKTKEIFLWIENKLKK
ncbi:HEPN domain-containing protein [Candidatus Gottesmanbacteria bacterium]|nr:HEPN domain-containing protein [Candidatus Gottesmanbacteria bacterium]